jgi:hypothetical protein
LYILGRDQRAIAAKDRRSAEVQMDVGGAGLDRAEKEVV